LGFENHERLKAIDDDQVRIQNILLIFVKYETIFFMVEILSFAPNFMMGFQGTIK
jgi:hypothetical protein